jgi:hypothetical protein
MRALFRDAARDATAVTAGMEIREIGLPQNPNKRDLYLRIREYFGGTNIDVYKTRNEAWTPPTPDTRIAYAEITTPMESGSVLMTPVGTTPDMTGLILQGVFPSLAYAEVHVWCYTAAPDLVVRDDLQTLLRLFVSPGRALFGISSDDIEVDGILDLGPFPKITIEGLPFEQDKSINRGVSDHLLYPTVITVGHRALLPVKDLRRAVRAWQSAIESILFDEHRQLHGQVFYLQPDGSSRPVVVGSTGVVAAEVRIKAEFLDMWRDYQFPRG